MGKMFSGLSTEGMETPEDKVGGGFQPLPSDIYDAKILMVYAGKARNSDAQNINVHMTINDQEHRETIYITNRNGENFYKDKVTGKPTPLPGFTTVDDLCLFVTEAGLAEQETEPKTVKLYNFDEQKEVPTEVPMLTALMGAEVKVALLRVIEDKRKQGDDGDYHPTGETRTFNSIDKVFHPETGRTVNEYRHGVESAEFAEAWMTKNTGKDRNKAKGANGAGGAGTSGTGAPGAAQSQKKKLFS